MSNSFSKWVAEFFSKPQILPKSKSKRIGIKRVKHILGKLKVKISDFKNVIHITGTTGKGTTAIILAHILKYSGQRVALITKPHLWSATERANIDGKLISSTELLKNIKLVHKLGLEASKQHKYGSLEYTEIMFISVLKYMYERRDNIDYLIVEAGIGAKYDYTNIFNEYHKRRNYYTILTSVHRDHIERLGKTLKSIYDHKISVAKHANKSFILFNPLTQIGLQAEIPKNAIILAGTEKYRIKSDIGGSSISFKPELKIKNKTVVKESAEITYNTNLFTTFAVRTVAKSIEIAKSILGEQFKVPNKELDILLPARFEPFYSHTHKKLLIIDNSHNKHQYLSLKRVIDSLRKKHSINFNLATTFWGEEKLNYATRRLESSVKRMFYVDLKYHDAISFTKYETLPKSIKAKFSKLENVEELFEVNGSNAIPILTGSVYSVGKFMRDLNYRPVPLNAKDITNAKYYQKYFVRVVMQNVRNNLSSEYIEKTSIEFCKNYVQKLENSEKVAIYFPINNELNILKLFELKPELKTKRIFAPYFNKISNRWEIAEIRNKELDNPIQSGAALHKIDSANVVQLFRSFNSADFGNRDYIFVPCLAFDKLGNRIGYGGGTYDKLLRGLTKFRTNIVIVGYKWQLVHRAL